MSPNVRSTPKPDDATSVTVDGHSIRLTHLDKVIYPETGTTKAEVLDYYARVAEVLIAHASNRPLTRKRWVHGVGTAQKPGLMFFQKNLDDSTPDWVARRTIAHRDHSIVQQRPGRLSSVWRHRSDVVV